MQSSMKIRYIFSHNVFKILMLRHIVNLLFAILLSSDFLQSSDIYKL